MIKRSTILVVILLSISMILSGTFTCDAEERTRTISDMLGREVEIPGKVEKVVGIEAGALRLLVYMQAVDKVVGVEDFEKRDGDRPYIMAHPELQGKPSIGPQHGGDAELITAQKPDVIFWTYTTAGKADDLQRKTGIPVIALNYGDLDDNRDTFYGGLELVGEVLKKGQRAEELKTFFDDTIADLNQRTEDVPEEEKPSCYVGGIGYKGAHGIKSTEPDYSPFQFVNAKNVAGGLETEHAMVDPEKIIEWNPEVMFIDEGGYELVLDDIKNNSEYSSIDAIEENKVYGVLPYNYYTANYGTILIDSYYIGSILYEDGFGDLDIERKADRIYQKLLGEGVYDQMNETFGGYKNLENEIGSDDNGGSMGPALMLPVALAIVVFISFTTYCWKRKKR